MRNIECNYCNLSCELIKNDTINNEIFSLDFIYSGSANVKIVPPKAGQFFMIKPKRSGVFLGRPVSVAMWEPAIKDQDYIRRKAKTKKNPYYRYLTGKFLESDTVRFMIARRGKGTQELTQMNIGEEAELVGPLGNAWTDFFPNYIGKPVALVSGGIGIAPMFALLGEMEIDEETPRPQFDFYAGFKTGFKTDDEKHALLGPVYTGVRELILATENGKSGLKGRIPDFLEPEKYSAVFACGPEPMLKAVAVKCKAAGVPCYVSMEKRMACGVGACLGCTVKTGSGNRRCCADGPIFNADEVVFDD